MVTCPSAMSTTFVSLRTHKTVVPCIAPPLCALFWLIGIPPLYAGPGDAPKGGRPYLCARTVAFLWAIASIEIIGLTPEALGNDEPSMTNRFFASQVSPCGFVADLYGESPIRAVPMM